MASHNVGGYYRQPQALWWQLGAGNTTEGGNPMLLDSYRALDLTDEKGYLCGRVLGDLGVDVIKVENPQGDPGRHIGPFFQDIPDPEKSLFWQAYNLNKRGITLDIEKAEGCSLFKRLVERTDFVIESFPPGYMDNLGLGYSVLSQINPRIIMTSITPFGQTGPYKDLQAPDIVVGAMGGVLYTMGDPDRPPVNMSFPQAYSHGALEAAIGTLLAHHYREASGEGQHVDVSVQASLIALLSIPFSHWEMRRRIIRRSGGYARARSDEDVKVQVIQPAKDGYFAFQPYGGILGLRHNQEMVKWMDSEGMAPDFLKEKDWASFDMDKVSQEELDEMNEAFVRFLQKYTREEIFQNMVARGIMGHPVNT
ncbi:MAG: CaiB/BaiF CoA transferase family protein, partial [Dehalococcoidia bacterium]